MKRILIRFRLILLMFALICSVAACKGSGERIQERMIPTNVSKTQKCRDKEIRI